MKYIIVLGDGMADEPIEELGGKTPIEYADTPAMDRLAPLSEVGLAATIPDGMKPGSDTANLAVLGYNPKKYYTGRSPLEALSIGVDMKATDIALRCNIVTLSEEDVPYEERTILDHSSDEISTEDAAVLLDAVKEVFENEIYRFYVGTSYRHLLIWDNGKVVEGKNKANSLWFWGAGTRPALSSFYDKTGKKGAMISAVDLLKGIAVGAGMRNIEVPGANGGLNTNYEGKAEAGVKALLEEGADFVYIHVEAPDEMGHQGSVERKVKAIEYLDQRLIRIVAGEMDRSGEDYRLLIMPDHPTPISCRTHVSDPVPYLLYDSRKNAGQGLLYSEANGKKSGILIKDGYKMIDRLLQD